MHTEGSLLLLLFWSDRSHGQQSADKWAKNVHANLMPDGQIGDRKLLSFMSRSFAVQCIFKIHIVRMHFISMNEWLGWFRGPSAFRHNKWVQFIEMALEFRDLPREGWWIVRSTIRTLFASESRAINQEIDLFMRVLHDPTKVGK